MSDDEFKLICERCGKEAEIDEERSDEECRAYKIQCECGGKFLIVFEKQ